MAMLCPLCREELFFDHMMLAWRCQECKRYFVLDEKDQSLRATGSKLKFMLC